MDSKRITFHGVLAGAYKGKALEDRALLIHASDNDGETGLCKKVKVDSLGDEYGTKQDVNLVTCEHCKIKLRKLGLLA